MSAHQGRRTCVEIELPNLLLRLHAAHQVLNAGLNRRTPLLVDGSSIRGRLTDSTTRQHGNGRNVTGQQKDPASSRGRTSPKRDPCTKINAFTDSQSVPIRFGSFCCYICFTSTRLHASMFNLKCSRPFLSACSTSFFVFQANFRSSAVCSRVGGSGCPIASQAVTASPCCRSSTSTSNEARAGKWSRSSVSSLALPLASIASAAASVFATGRDTCMSVAYLY